MPVDYSNSIIATVYFLNFVSLALPVVLECISLIELYQFYIPLDYIPSVIIIPRDCVSSLIDEDSKVSRKGCEMFGLHQIPILLLTHQSNSAVIAQLLHLLCTNGNINDMLINAGDSTTTKYIKVPFFGASYSHVKIRQVCDDHTFMYTSLWLRALFNMHVFCL